MKLFKQEQGQGLVEYSLLLVLVAVVVVGALLLLGPQINQIYGRVITGLLGGGTQYAYTINSFTVSNEPKAGGRCKYKITASVTVKDKASGLNAPDGTSVSGSASGYGTTLLASGTTSSGTATLKGDGTVNNACLDHGTATLVVVDQTRTYTW